MNVPELRFSEFKSEWKDKKIGDLSSIITKGTTPSSLGYKFTEKGINFIKTENITENGIINIKDTPKISKECNEKLSRSKLKENDILFSIAGTLGRTAIIKKNFLPANTNQALAIIRLKEKSCVKFVNYLLNLDQVKKYMDISVTVGAQPNLNLQQVSDIKINLPSLKEQKKIVSFLSKVDKKIEKLEKKEELWQTYKKGMMHQLFNQKLRFKNENRNDYHDWEDKSLNEFVSRVTRKNNDLKSDLPLTISAQHGLIDQETFFNKKVASESLKGYYLLKKGEFAYNKSYSNGFPWGAIRRLEKYDHGALSTLYICFSLNESVNPDFMVQYFLSDKWHKEISLIAVEGARNHGLLNIGVNDFFNTKHIIPSFPEQEKIANFLSAIDEKIEIVNKELEINREFKRGLLQQMFPSDKKSRDIKTQDLSKLHKNQIEQSVLL